MLREVRVKGIKTADQREAEVSIQIRLIVEFKYQILYVEVSVELSS